MKNKEIEMFGNYRGGFDSLVELREDDFGGCEIIYVIDGSVDYSEKGFEEVIKIGIEEGVWIRECGNEEREEDRLVEKEDDDMMGKWDRFIEKVEV
jgi:hypothetical protein